MKRKRILISCLALLSTSSATSLASAGDDETILLDNDNRFYDNHLSGSTSAPLFTLHSTANNGDEVTGLQQSVNIAVQHEHLGGNENGDGKDASNEKGRRRSHTKMRADVKASERPKGDRNLIVSDDFEGGGETSSPLDWLDVSRLSTSALSHILKYHQRVSSSLEENYLERGSDGHRNLNNDDGWSENEECTKFLVKFLEGSTDAKDNCDGMMNAYVAAKCNHLANEQGNYDDDHDDYFGEFYSRSCCPSMKSHYFEYCEEDYITDRSMLSVVALLLLGEISKSIIKKNQIHWLPEAGGCILVGLLCGVIAKVIPGVSIDDLSFDDELFLIVLLPAIIFEAALAVNKREFRRRRMSIFMFAVVGTALSSFATGFMVHYTSSWINVATTLPMLDSLVFGTLISSIDPVAILSVLTSLNVVETDTIFILVFGESLLNDGVAITLFKSLKTCYSDSQMDTDAVLGSVADFLIVAFGSIGVGMGSGFLCMLYYWLLQSILHPVMEVGSFFLWALVPYYISDSVELSGIVAIVVMGFIMDLYVCAQKDVDNDRRKARNDTALPYPSQENGPVYVDFKEGLKHKVDSGLGSGMESSPTHEDDICRAPSFSHSAIFQVNVPRVMFGTSSERVRLSPEADQHVRFVAHLLASLSENAIFVYLGLFLFSKYYEWDGALVTIGVISCVLARVVMVMVVSWSIWHIHVLWQRSFHSSKRKVDPDESTYGEKFRISKTVKALQDSNTRIVLVLSGLRGAVSLALVEDVPIYNAVTEEGSEYKQVMKAMTSASIMFTVFVFGGSAYYILRNLGVAGRDDNDRSDADSSTIVSEMQRMGSDQNMPHQHMDHSDLHFYGDPRILAYHNGEGMTNEDSVPGRPQYVSPSIAPPSAHLRPRGVESGHQQQNPIPTPTPPQDDEERNSPSLDQRTSQGRNRPTAQYEERAGQIGGPERVMSYDGTGTRLGDQALEPNPTL